MTEHIVLGLSAGESDSDEVFLAEYDACIRTVARRVMRPRFFSDDVLDLEADELVQNIRIKLWESRQKRSINKPGAYIRTIAHTTAIDNFRRYRPTVSLSIDPDEEVNLVDRLVAHNEGFQDPAYEIEFREIEPDLLTKLVDAILALPPRQRQAMLSFLKEQRGDVLPLINAFKARNVNIEAINLPEELCEMYLLKASLSVARKKLRQLFKKSVV